MTAWRYSTLSVLLTLLAACATAPVSRDAVPVQPVHGSVCHAYAQAWVAHFRAHVAGAGLGVTESRLQQARTQLAAEGVAEGDCERPYCMVVPLAGGRLDSYYGNRRPHPSGRELYQWVPFR